MSFLLEVHVHPTQLEETLETLAVMPFEIDPTIRNAGHRAIVEFPVNEPEHADRVQNALTARGLREVRVNVHDAILT